MDLLKSIFKGDKVVWIIFLMLCLISVVEVFSASSTLTFESGNHWGPITQHSIFLLTGALVVVLCHNIPYRWFQVLPVILLPISLIFLAMLLFFDKLNIAGLLVIEKINDAGRWIKLCGVTFQPSELGKMGVVIATAFILSKRQSEQEANPKAFKHIMIVACLVCGLIFPENFSTSALLFGVVFLMMYIGRVATRKLLLLMGTLGGILVAGIIFLTVTKDIDSNFLHRLDSWRGRIENFTKTEKVAPNDFDINANAQEGHARIAVATSNVIGKGPGNSVERDFLSQAYSDFIFAIIIEELGLVGGIVVVFLYICLLIRIGRIAKKCNRTFPAFLVIGIGLLLVTQALFNMMVAVGLAPITGQPLPLISRGGTSTLINCVYIGMILSVSRYTAAIEEEEKRLAEQRLRDAMIPMTVDAGQPEETAAGAAEATSSSEAQTAQEPTSAALNSDDEFN
ncbi:MAG: FtsW/RodA/SpoVE family cell cycle protein [Bacteroides sp.]